MAERENAISRRDFLVRGTLGAGFATAALLLDMGHESASQIWNRTLQSNPLGAKLKQEEQFLGELKGKYNQNDTPYDQRVQIQKAYDEHQAVAAEITTDISRTIDPSNDSSFPHFRWWLSDSPVVMAAAFAVVGVGSMLSTLGSKFGRRQPLPQQPQTT